VHCVLLACDYDETLADEGEVAPASLKALEQLTASKRRLVLATGRMLDDLLEAFPEVGIFDRVVAENGAVTYDPSTRQRRRLADPPPELLVDRLRRVGVSPLSTGDVIVATRTPHEVAVLEAIRELGLGHQVMFNKGAVMILPPSVDKGTGLAAVLEGLAISPHDVVAVGDGENDHALLSRVGLGVAVENAVPSLKERADWVTESANGAGVRELIGRILSSDPLLFAAARNRS
jgi:hydroxymethylpyrimidine pyrophosphatase-like HAD family hydrolase